jgi:hypothetical protein
MTCSTVVSICLYLILYIQDQVIEHDLFAMEKQSINSYFIKRQVVYCLPFPTDHPTLDRFPR